MRKLIGDIFRANEKFKLLEDGDKVCIGISGGKDSMAMAYALKIWQKIAREENGINIELVAVHMKFSLCAIDYEELETFFKKIDMEFHIHPTPTITNIIREFARNNESPCGLCSKMKKAILIDKAKEYGCNKVAMGHHMDDAIETLFMNMIHGGRIATFKPKMYLDRADIWFIRPFALSREKTIIKGVNQASIPVVPCSCPLEGSTQRDTVREWLNSTFYKNPMWQASYENFATAILNEEQCELWFDSMIRHEEEKDSK